MDAWSVLETASVVEIQFLLLIISERKIESLKYSIKILIKSISDLRS